MLWLPSDRVCRYCEIQVGLPGMLVTILYTVCWTLQRIYPLFSLPEIKIYTISTWGLCLVCCNVFVKRSWLLYERFFFSPNNTQNLTIRFGLKYLPSCLRIYAFIWSFPTWGGQDLLQQTYSWCECSLILTLSWQFDHFVSRLIMSHDFLLRYKYWYTGAKKLSQ